MRCIQETVFLPDNLAWILPQKNSAMAIGAIAEQLILGMREYLYQIVDDFQLRIGKSFIRRGCRIDKFVKNQI